MNTTNQRLSKLIRIDSRYSALCLLRWFRACNRMARKLHNTPYCTTIEARQRLIETYGW